MQPRRKSISANPSQPTSRTIDPVSSKTGVLTAHTPSRQPVRRVRSKARAAPCLIVSSTRGPYHQLRQDQLSNEPDSCCVGRQRGWRAHMLRCSRGKARGLGALAGLEVGLAGTCRVARRCAHHALVPADAPVDAMPPPPPPFTNTCRPFTDNLVGRSPLTAVRAGTVQQRGVPRSFAPGH